MTPARETEVPLVPHDPAEAVLTIDADSTIVYASPAIEAVFGYPADELVGGSLLKLIPPEMRQAHLRGLGRYLTTGERSLPWDGVEIPALHRDGSRFDVEIAFGSYTVEGRIFFTGIIRDISRKDAAERALAISEARYRQLFERNVAGVYRITIDGMILEINDAMARMLGYGAADELIGARTPELHVQPADRVRWRSALEEKGTLENYELELRRRDGGTIWILENASLIEDHERGTPLILGTAIDITERKQLERELERMAYHDPLTGLANRRLLAELAGKALAAAARHGHAIGMIYVDVVRFKRVNDALGHAVGDQALIEVGERLERAVRESDTVARVGGDEFAVLLDQTAGFEEARAVAVRVHHQFDPPFVVGDESFHLDGRLGLALYPDHAESFNELLTVADLSMIHARGGAHDLAIRESTSVPRREDFDLEEDLRQALAKDRLVLHYQPVFSLPESDMTGVEALARWDHSARGLLPAGAFVPLAERTGQTRALDAWALATAVRRIGTWPGDDPPEWVAVNLSPASFEDPTLPGRVGRILEAENVDGGRLIVEVTERVAMRDPDRAVATLAALRDLGVKIAIDDFGRGHSALAYLLHFQADILKIDRLFVDRLGADIAHERLVEGILALGREIGMSLVAEGVERAEQLAWLEEHGCDFVQGYHLARPGPVEALAPEASVRGDPDRRRRLGSLLRPFSRRPGRRPAGA